jgi:VanZ family protein
MIIPEFFATAPQCAAMLATTGSAVLHSAAWRRRWAWLCAALVAVVGIAALTPGDAAPTLSASDKFDHLLAFAALAGAGALSVQPRWPSVMKVAVLMLAYGAFIELAQTQVPGRYGDLNDWFADAVGVCLGLALVRLLRWRWPPVRS